MFWNSCPKSVSPPWILIGILRKFIYLWLYRTPIFIFLILSAVRQCIAQYKKNHCFLTSKIVSPRVLMPIISQLFLYHTLYIYIYCVPSNTKGYAWEWISPINLIINGTEVGVKKWFIINVTPPANTNIPQQIFYSCGSVYFPRI